MTSDMNSSFSYAIHNGVIVDTPEACEYQWHHYDLSDDQYLLNIEQEVDIPVFARRALVSEATRPRLESFDQGVLVILRGVNLNEDSRPEDMISVRIWLQENKIITAHFRDSQSIELLRQQVQNGKVPKSSSGLLSELTALLFEKIEVAIMDLDTQVDDIEEGLTTGSDIKEDREKISNIRKKIIAYKRHLMPQREAVRQLRGLQLSWLHDSHHNFHSESYEKIIRSLEDLEALRDRLTVVKEEVFQMLSDRLNRNTYVLSIVAAVFLPLGFLTGLLGINISGIPGADYPHAFWAFCGVLLVLSIAQIVFFRRMKWI